MVGDILVEIAGTPVEGPDSVRAAIAGKPGQTVDVVLTRGGQRQATSVALGSRA